MNLPQDNRVPTTVQWLDAFFSTMETICGVLGDRAEFNRQFGGAIEANEGTMFDKDAYRGRKIVWKKTREYLESFDISEIEFEGAQNGPAGVQFNAKGDIVVTDPKGLALFRENENARMVIPHPEAQCAANFLTFYIESYSKGVDPRQYVRSVLHNSGITRENFHEHSDKLAITNPWE